jgi:hypothetical protein
MRDEFQAVRFLEKKRTNSGPFMASTSKHSIYTRETPAALPYPILSYLSRPRLAALRLAAGRCGRPPLGARDAASAASKRRPPAEAGGRGGEAKKGFILPIRHLRRVEALLR